MARWQPDAQQRLAAAAMDLFDEHGFDQVTVNDIAGRAGLTARTFFRYYADKREVLFGGADALLDVLTAGVAARPGLAPLAAVAAALDAVSDVIGTDRDFSRRRSAVIAANPDLQERELIKLSSWSRTLATALRDRGDDPLTAGLAAETGIAAFRVGFDSWLQGSARTSLATAVRAAMTRLRELAAPPDDPPDDPS